jgi:hypothetical protein
VVIDTELGKKSHSSISATAIRRGLKPANQIKPVVKEKKKVLQKDFLY